MTTSIPNGQPQEGPFGLFAALLALMGDTASTTDAPHAPPAPLSPSIATIAATLAPPAPADGRQAGDGASEEGAEAPQASGATSAAAEPSAQPLHLAAAVAGGKPAGGGCGCGQSGAARVADPPAVALHAALPPAAAATTGDAAGGIQVKADPASPLPSSIATASSAALAPHAPFKNPVPSPVAPPQSEGTRTAPAATDALPAGGRASSQDPAGPGSATSPGGERARVRPAAAAAAAAAVALATGGEPHQPLGARAAANDRIPDARLDAASTAIDPTGSTAATRPSTPAPPPQPAPIALPVVALHIAQAAQAGIKRFEIRLDPPELGRIEVRLDVTRDGHATTHLVVERAETLDLLQRDARHLERALQNAGLNTSDGGLTFSLKDQSQAQRGPQHHSCGASSSTAGDSEGPSEEADWSPVRALGCLDIRI